MGERYSNQQLSLVIFLCFVTLIFLLRTKIVIIRAKEETVIGKSIGTGALSIAGDTFNDKIRQTKRFEEEIGTSNGTNDLAIQKVLRGKSQKPDKLDTLLEKIDKLETMFTNLYSLQAKNFELQKGQQRKHPVCELLPTPTPIVLLSLGRSGTGVTWQVMGNLTGEETPSCEYTGSGTLKSKDFFDKIGPNDGGNWVLEYMCNEQKKYPSAAIVGFKWKPFEASFFSEASLNGLKMIANSVNPAIKIVRSRRNLLDVIISQEKHRLEHSLNGHCQVGDVKCLERHKKVGMGITLPTKNLIENLEYLTKVEDSVDKLLVKMNIPHIHVTYENLYHSNDAKEWKKLLKFLRIEKKRYKYLTMEQVENSMAYVSTSSNRQEEILSNFKQVRKILKGTKFKSLLH